MASVELDKINKVYDNGFHAVKDLSISVADGEFLVLVGPSGCGKSTALRMVAGLEDISNGELRIGGRRVNEVEPQGRDIAMVFQSYALYPHMSVRDNIAYGLKLRKMPKDEMDRRIKGAADMLELTPLLERKPKQLSGGQRQRVAMGRAIVREPQVFLMDEPLSNLDAKLRVQMRAEISAVVRSLKTTTLYVTHDQTEAMTMGDRMAIMKAGILQQLGSPGECYDTPNNIFVAQFVGSPPMNLVMAKVEAAGEGLQLRIGGNTLAVPASTLTERPALKNYVGKEIVLGVRSEDMEDSNLATNIPPEQRFKGKVALTEALGSEVVVHFTFDGKEYVSADTKLIAAEAGGEELHTLTDAGVKWVASFAPRSRVHMGDDVDIAVDIERAHYFDAESSDAIRN
ncbi:MAG: ABC transporter ATP-binding protein [Candidatus Nanopelagicales bacterium]